MTIDKLDQLYWSPEKTRQFRIIREVYVRLNGENIKTELYRWTGDLYIGKVIINEVVYGVKEEDLVDPTDLYSELCMSCINSCKMHDILECPFHIEEKIT